MVYIKTNRNKLFRKPFCWSSSGSELRNDVSQNYWGNLSFSLNTHNSGIILNYKCLNLPIGILILIKQHNDSVFFIHLTEHLFQAITVLKHRTTRFS